VHAVPRSNGDDPRYVPRLSGHARSIRDGGEAVTNRRKASYLPPIIPPAVAGFLGLIAVFALDAYWDLPARSFGAFLKPIRHYEFSIKVVAALFLFITVLGVLREAILRIQHLSHMLTMCAWCRRV